MMIRSWLARVGLLFLVCVPRGAFSASQPFDYDANGNLTSSKGKYYEYNDANKLVRVREGSKEGPVLAEFWYDYKGQRVKKVENGITTYYIGKQYEERKGPSIIEKTNFYFAGGQRVARKTQKDNKAAETFYYLNNHLGSTEVVTNTSGTVIDRLEYFPYGSIRNTGSERYSYTGKEKDAGTGQYYYEARYYDASAQHFTQADTLTPTVYEPQGLNRYSYVTNNPVKYIDKTGHFSQKPNHPGFLKKASMSIVKIVKIISGSISDIYNKIDNINPGIFTKNEANIGKISNVTSKTLNGVDATIKVKDTLNYSESIDDNTTVNEKDKDSLKLLRSVENFFSNGAISKWMTPGSGEMLEKHGPSKYGEYESGRLKMLKELSDSPGTDYDENLMNEYNERYPH